MRNIIMFLLETCILLNVSYSWSVCVCAHVFVCVLYRALAMPLSYSLQV